MIRNSQEKVLATMRAPVEFSLDPIVVEAMIALNTYMFCRDLGFHNIILEGDAKVVVEATNKMEENFMVILKRTLSYS